MKKKIFIVSKLYDTEIMTDNEIRVAVQADIDRLIGREGVVKFDITTKDKETDLIFHRGLDYDDTTLNKGLMSDADGYLVCGIGLDGFKLPEMWAGVPYGYSYFFQQSEFTRCYRKSAVKLGASRIKDLELEVKRDGLTLKIR